MSDKTTHYDSETRSSSSSGTVSALKGPRLTILAHPDSDRVGESVVLDALMAGKTVQLSRHEPIFAPPAGGRARNLGDDRISRSPVLLRPEVDGAVILDSSSTRLKVEANGRVVEGRQRLTREALEIGVVLMLASRVVLVLRLTDLVSPVSCAPSLIGESAAVVRVRSEIQKVADRDLSVMIRGESGTGKEIVAHAIHDASPRSGPFLAVNLAAISPELAPAELFGADRGAYTGADRRRKGYFQRAHRGTLLLDEIGEAAVGVQSPLLRAVETGQIESVGADQVQEVDVRVLAATDADLEEAVSTGRFKEPLLHRLTGYEIFLPPLRERREDIGLLFFYFLRVELQEVGESDRLKTVPGRRPWVPARLVAEIALAPWPGNVRELKNVVQQLAVANRGADRFEIPAGVRRHLANATEAPVSEESPVQPSRRLTEEAVLAALDAADYAVEPAAKRLGVSKPVVYEWIERIPGIYKASDLPRERIEEAKERYAGDTKAMARSLKVSPRGLTARMNKLGID